MKKEIIVRYKDNPILERDTIVGYDALFNPGVIDFGDKIILAVRAARDDRKYIGQGHSGIALFSNQICDHILFESTDGENFVMNNYKIAGSSSTWMDYNTGKPAVPTYFGPFGAEDIRLCKIGDTYIGVIHVMTHYAYTGDAKAGGRIGLILTKDFKHFKRYLVGPKREETDRDAPTIQVAFFNHLEELLSADDKYWKEHMDNLDQHVILAPKYEWEAQKVGAGPVLEHEKGYILFYHGVNNRVYSTGVALLDKETMKVTYRLPEPLLTPTEWYEIGEFGGDVPNITFVGGARYANDKKSIELYYGAADTHVAKAIVPSVEELIEEIIKYPE